MIRIFLLVAFVVSLYGGISLLTAVTFIKGYVLIALVSGLVLSVMTAVPLALLGLACSMSRFEDREDPLGLAGQPA